MELNLAALHEAVAAAVPDRECIVWRHRRLTWADVTDRSRRVAAVLRDAGRGLDIPYAEVDKIAKLVPQQPGQDITIAKAEPRYASTFM